MATLFISDLHLCKDRPHITRLFIDFLGNEASQAEALYILGDLFEVWLGDDAIAPEDRSIVEALSDLTGQGIPVYVMVGNRDFLLGEDFARQTGCRLLPDPSVIDLYGEATLLMHGDTLCIDDLDYQNFRAMVRDEHWQQTFLAKPLVERQAFGREARDKSRAATREKPDDIMDANAQAVVDAMQEAGVTRLIHGHTHRPAVHQLMLKNSAATRIVLGDWYTQESILRVDAGGFELSRLGHHAWNAPSGTAEN